MLHGGLLRDDIPGFTSERDGHLGRVLAVCGQGMSTSPELARAANRCALPILCLRALRDTLNLMNRVYDGYPLSPSSILGACA